MAFRIAAVNHLRLSPNPLSIVINTRMDMHKSVYKSITPKSTPQTGRQDGATPGEFGGSKERPPGSAKRASTPEEECLLWGRIPLPNPFPRAGRTSREQSKSKWSYLE
jgi:hypothetical protein